MTELRLLILEPASFIPEQLLYIVEQRLCTMEPELFMEEPIHWLPVTMNLMLVWQVPRLVLPS